VPNALAARASLDGRMSVGKPVCSARRKEGMSGARGELQLMLTTVYLNHGPSLETPAPVHRPICTHCRPKSHESEKARAKSM